MIVTDEVEQPEVIVRPKRPAPKKQTNFKKQPQYAVIVLNDDLHTFAYVIDVLCKTCGHNALNALLLAQEVDQTGRASVWTGTLELAELKRDLIHGFGPDTYPTVPVTFPLGVVIEPLPV